MPELRNPRWEKFAQAYVLTGNASEALRRSGYKASTPSTITSDASRLLTFADVKQRINQLRAKSLLSHTMEREDVERYFASVVNTPVSEITPDHPLAQGIEITDKGTKIRTPDKNVAAQALARMNGWEQAQRVDLTLSNPLTTYLRQLRGSDARVIEDSETSVGDQGVSP